MTAVGLTTVGPPAALVEWVSQGYRRGGTAQEREGAEDTEDSRARHGRPPYVLNRRKQTRGLGTGAAERGVLPDPEVMSLLCPAVVG